MVQQDLPAESASLPALGDMPTLAVIVPATDRPTTLPACVEAIEASLGPGDEVIVVTDPVADSPAAARNAGATRANADVLVFIDSDVVIRPDALARLREAFASDPHLTAVFGSYDDEPASPGVVSQFRNLLHHYHHQRHSGDAMTFWSGIGAIRRAEFLVLGGFDTEKFDHAAVEDIDLGMRLRGMGGRIELHPEIQGTHLKSWTLARMVHTDYYRRGVPWALMCIERRSLPRTLNLSWRERSSTLAMLATAAGVLARRPRLAAGGMLALSALDAPFYLLLYRRIGARLAAASIVLHALHRVVGVAAVPGGVAEYLRRRR